jgi:hypothetical protein
MPGLDEQIVFDPLTDQIVSCSGRKAKSTLSSDRFAARMLSSSLVTIDKIITVITQ